MKNIPYRSTEAKFIDFLLFSGLSEINKRISQSYRVWEGLKNFKLSGGGGFKAYCILLQTFGFVTHTLQNNNKTIFT